MRTLLGPVCAVVAQLACGGERAYLIKGRVTTAAGEPLAGAVVALAASCPASWPVFPALNRALVE